MHTWMSRGGVGGKGEQAQVTRSLSTGVGGGMGRDAESFLLHLERE